MIEKQRSRSLQTSRHWAAKTFEYRYRVLQGVGLYDFVRSKNLNYLLVRPRYDHSLRRFVGLFMHRYTACGHLLEADRT